MSKLVTIYRDENPIYDIMIENSFIKLGEKITQIGLAGRKFCVVSDSSVAPLYLDAVKKELELHCKAVSVIDFVFPAGEENKTLYVVRDLYETLILNHFERGDILVALGGGVVGDLTGYAAATYLRGIDFIQCPTTLLSQVDSSIGGKTGVDFDSYKNMVGAFHMPRLVYMNMSTLLSLDERIYLSGYGEIIKHAYIKNADYLTFLINHKDELLTRDVEALEEVIYESCKIKGEVVRIDPTEKGERMLLNFGHTLGHAIEKLCGFTLYHGECVVLGMICALQISVSRGLISAEEMNAALDFFRSLKFPTTVTNMTAENVLQVSRSDKKMKEGKIRFVLLQEVGKAYVDYEVSDEEMISSLQSVLR